jgi:2-haloacid dehalogenase
MTEIRAILFDVFGTVVDWRGSLIADLTAWGEANGIAADWTGLADAWRGEYAPSMDRVRRGERPWAILDDLHRDSLRTLLPRFGVSALSADQSEHVNRVWRRLHPWPDSVAGLQRLKRRFAICALSNGNVALLLDMAKFAALPWDMVFGADVFRHYKPDPETYLGACGLLGLAPAQVLMAAAHPSDLAAAGRLGLRTAFISRPLEFGAAQLADDGGGPWDYSVNSVQELANILET